MEKRPLLLANPAVRQAYDAQAPEFELARELIAAPAATDPLRKSASIKPKRVTFSLVCGLPFSACDG